MSDYLPENDGVDHINVSQHGKTQLGMMLDNLADVQFTHPDYGRFRTVEGFYWWLVSGKKVQEFRDCDGRDALEMGKRFHNDPHHLSGRLFNQVANAIYLKVMQNPGLKRMLRESTLPITCYVTYGWRNRKVRLGKGYQNHTSMLTILRDQLKLENS